MIKRVLMFMVALLLLRLPLAGQVEMTGEVNVTPPTSFFVDALTFAGQDSARDRLDLFIQVGYDNLTFVKHGDTYDASYEVTATLLDSTNAVLSEQNWTEQINGISFDATVAAGAAKVSQRSLQVQPGRYTIVVQIRDNENKAARRIQEEIVASPLNRRGLNLSSIMLLSKVTAQGGKRTIVPNISPNVGNIPEAFYFFLEAYNNDRLDSVGFTASVQNQKGEEFARADTAQRCVPGRNEVIMRVANSTLPVGDYKLIVTAHRPGEPEPLAVSVRSIIVRWRGLPTSMKNLDVAIDQLRYIGRDSELDSLKSAKTTEEKQRLFLEFWKRRDPNPNTPRNEKMEEYYARVEYANRHFSHYMEGWKTDMGMVYIIFGPPNNVERHPFDIDSKPYEVWSYYDINQNFAFMDETGFGDYRLITPLWEVWRKPR